MVVYVDQLHNKGLMLLTPDASISEGHPDKYEVDASSDDHTVTLPLMRGRHKRFTPSQPNIRSLYQSQALASVVVATFGSPHSVGSLQERGPFILDTSFSDFAFKFDFGDVEQRFDIDEPELVEPFLRAHDDLCSFLLDLHHGLRNSFPSEDFFLELVVDPNEPSGTEILISVQVEEDSDSKLQDFRQNWWQHHRYRAERRVSVDLKYV